MSSSSLFPAESGQTFTKIFYNDTYAEISPKASSHSGKVVFVNGASKGIGRAIALSYAKSGVSGLIISARASLALWKEKSRKFLDVLDFASVAEAAKSIETTFGRLDILINNAGYCSTAKNIVDGDKDEWWMNLEINLRGVYWVTKCLLPLLLKTDGGDKTIVNLSSVAALLVGPGMSGYQMSKFGLVRFTETLCVEYGDQDLLAYSVHPGAVVTDLSSALPEDYRKLLIDTPELAADTIPYLTSQKRKWLAGRYLSCNWDMAEIMSREKEIVDGDKLKFRMNF